MGARAAAPFTYLLTDLTNYLTSLYPRQMLELLLPCLVDQHVEVSKGAWEEVSKLARTQESTRASKHVRKYVPEGMYLYGCECEASPP